MSYKLRREAHEEWWADHSKDQAGICEEHWGPRGYAVRYREKGSAESQALKLAKFNGPILIYGPPYNEVIDTVVWTQEHETQAKVEQAVKERVAALEAKYRDDLKNETEAAKRRTAEHYEAKMAAALRDAKPKYVVPATCPEYYRLKLPWAGVELMVFDFIEAVGANFSIGCALKYLCRVGKKGQALPDLEKAKNCIEQEIARVKRASPVQGAPFDEPLKFVVSGVSTSY